MRIAVIIPTLNEEQTIGKVLDAISQLDNYSIHSYVIDGLSTDNTRAIARKKGAKIIMEKKKGKGRAVKTALEELKDRYEIVIMLDGDYTYDPGDIPRFVNKLTVCDFVFGRRIIKKGAMGLSHKLGNFLITWVANVLYERKISDLCTGYIGFGKKALEEMEISATGFDLEANIFAQAVKKGLKICEVPIKYRASIAVSKLNSIIDGMEIMAMLLKERLTW